MITGDQQAAAAEDQTNGGERPGRADSHVACHVQLDGGQDQFLEEG